MNRQSLKRISIWGKILGIITMVGGGISALPGLFVFIVGAIPGLLTAFTGYLLYRTGKDAQEFLESQSEESIASILDNYARYLLIQSILLITSITVFFLCIIIFTEAYV